jgi:hypothetical protein
VLSFIASSLRPGRITGLADIMVGPPEGAVGVKREFCVSMRPGLPPLRWHQVCIVVSPSCPVAPAPPVPQDPDRRFRKVWGIQDLGH